MLPASWWSSFLHDRGVDLDRSAVEPLVGGEVNDNWKITASGREKYVLRHYRATHLPAEIDCELAAVDILARAGFPTPAPVPSTEGRLWALIDGRPAALFTFAHGTHPQQRPGGYGSMDRDLGCQAARLAGELGRTLDGRRLPGWRSASRDAWHRIDGFLSDASPHPVFAELLDPLHEIHEQLRPMYLHPPAGLPYGLIHHDLTPSNLLVEATGQVSAVLDFDDCAQTFLGYELGAIISTFGRDDERHVDLERITELVAAYNRARPMSVDERELLPDLIIAHHAAEGITVLSNWLVRGRRVTSPLESFSAQAFLELSASRADLYAEL